MIPIPKSRMYSLVEVYIPSSYSIDNFTRVLPFRLRNSRALIKLSWYAQRTLRVSRV